MLELLPIAETIVTRSYLSSPIGHGSSFRYIKVELPIWKEAEPLTTEMEFPEAILKSSSGTVAVTVEPIEYVSTSSSSVYVPELSPSRYVTEMP